MTIKLINQLPARLNVPVRTINGPLDPLATLRSDVVDELLKPMPGHTVQITDDAGNPVSVDEVMQLAESCLTSVADANAEDAMRDLLRQSLIHFDATPSLRFDDVYANQAGANLKLPAPSPTILYSADSDVIPSAKTLLVDPTSQAARDALLSALAYTYRPATTGVWFTSTDAYLRFAEWLDGEVQALAAVLNADVAAKFDQVRALPMTGLTESLLLRKDESDDADPTSFARLLVHFLDQYGIANPTDCGPLPFLLSEHLLPMSVVMVNVERTARATARALNREWRTIDTAISSPVKVISPRSITKLDTFARRQQAAMAASSKLTNQGQQVKKAPRVKLRKTRPSNAQIFKGVSELLKRFKQIAVSHNLAHVNAPTFSKANRRDPLNYNLPGRTRRIKYLPDLHIYLDTSGSVTEDNYRSSVMMMIALAKKLDVDLYLSSFSHELSSETLVQVRGRSAKQVWNRIQRIPKVSGGTDFEQIWRYIQASPVRRKRLSLMVTDFAWYAPTRFVKHPKNLIYAPCSNFDWENIRRFAEGFAKSAQHIDPLISRRFLGMQG